MRCAIEVLESCPAVLTYLYSADCLAEVACLKFELCLVPYVELGPHPIQLRKIVQTDKMLSPQ